MDNQKSASVENSPPIGGWLWLPSIGLTCGWLGFLSTVGGIRIDVYEIAASSRLADFPNARLFEKIILAVAGLYLLLNLTTAISFFRKRASAPKLVVVFCVCSVLFDIFLSVGASSALGANVNWDWFSLVTLANIIWIVYFLVAKRVKETFVL